VQEPRISIIVPVRNAERTLEKMFTYLLGLDYPHDKMEIIIADGGSADATLTITKVWQQKHDFIKLVEVPNCKSPGMARNAALKVVAGEYVLFTDGDCAPEPNWAREIIKPFFMDPKIGGVGGEVLTLRVEPDNLVESYCEQVRFLSPTGRCKLTASGYMPTIEDNCPSVVDGSDRCPFYATANVAFSKKAIDDIGGEFWHQETGEDVDFSLRVLGKGYQLYYAKEALVKHMHRVTLKSFLKQWYFYGYGHPLLLSKHAKPVTEVVINLFGKEFSIKTPIKKTGLINLGNFHFMHIFGALFLLFLVLEIWFPVKDWTTSWLLLFVLFLSRYFIPMLKLVPKRNFLTFCKIRYLTNLSFIRGSLAGRKKFGPLCIEPSW